MRLSSSLPLLLVLLPACDAPEVTGPLTVQVRDWNQQSVSGVRVLSHDGDGALVDEGASNETGNAIVAVTVGGSVSVVDQPSPVWSHVETIFDVSPDDDVTVRVDRGGSWGLPIRVTIPAMPAGATSFNVYGPCTGWSGTELSFTMYRTFACTSRGPLIVEALGPTGVVAYIEHADVDLGVESLTVTGSWEPPSHTFTIEATGFPTDGGSVNFQRTPLFEGYPLQYYYGVLETDGATGATTRPRFAAGDHVRHRIATSVSGGPCISAEPFIERTGLGALDRFAVDLADLPPAITVLETVDHDVRWTSSGRNTYATVEVATQGFPDGTPPEARWTARAPAGRTTLRIPDDLDTFWPGAGRDPVDTISVVEESSSRWLTYAEWIAAGPDAEEIPPDVKAGSAVEHYYWAPGCN